MARTAVGAQAAGEGRWGWDDALGGGGGAPPPRRADCAGNAPAGQTDRQTDRQGEPAAGVHGRVKGVSRRGARRLAPPPQAPPAGRQVRRRRVRCRPGGAAGGGAARKYRDWPQPAGAAAGTPRWNYQALPESRLGVPDVDQLPQAVTGKSTVTVLVRVLTDSCGRGRWGLGLRRRLPSPGPVGDFLVAVEAHAGRRQRPGGRGAAAHHWRVSEARS